MVYQLSSSELVKYHPWITTPDLVNGELHPKIWYFTMIYFPLWSPHLQGSTTEPTRQAVCSACNKKASEDSRAARNAKKLALRSIISLNDFLRTLQTAQEDECTTHNLIVALPKETYIALPTKTFTTNPKHTDLSYLMLHAKELVHIISEWSGYWWAWVSYPTMPKGEFHSPY